MTLLDWGAGLFIAHGALWFVIGILTPILLDRNVGAPMLIFSNASDTAAFGVPPDEMLRDPRVRMLRRILLDIVAGLLTAGGILVAAVAWFGVRAGETWALWTLTLVPLVVLPYWLLAARPFWRAGARVTLADAPPFMWVPTALYLPAVALAWLGA